MVSIKKGTKLLICLIGCCFFLLSCKNGKQEESPTVTPQSTPTLAPSEKPTEAPENTPTVTVQPTVNPVIKQMEDAAWEEGDCIREDLLYNQANSNYEDYWSIIDCGTFFIVNKDAFQTQNSVLMCIDKETGEETYFCTKEGCRHKGEATCISTNRSFNYNKGCLYDNQLFTVKQIQSDGCTLFQLVSFSLDKREEKIWSTFFQYTDDKACFCKELLLHNGKAAVVCTDRGGMDYLFVIDIINGQSEKIIEQNNMDGFGSIGRLNAYHNVLFFQYKVRERDINNSDVEMYRFDLKNQRLIDKKKLFIQRNYAVLDENKILYVRNGTMFCYNFLTDESTKISFDMPNPFPDNDFYRGEVGHIYCYKEYIILNEQKLKYVYTEPNFLTYYIYSADLTKRLAAFQVPVTEEKDISFDPKEEYVINALRKTDRLFIVNDMIYIQDRYTGVVSGCSLFDARNGNGNFTECYNNRTIETE